jgi:acetylornithine deacetylase/succinyl-diaminopimelate desuccinylase-like protein
MGEQMDEQAGPDAGVVELCSRLIRFDTSNYGDGESAGEREAAEFVAGELSAFDPTVLESAPRRANVVIRVPGLDRSSPAVLVHGHLDVVPAVAAEWAVPPFAGEVRDGYLWGRGAVDMKDMCAMMTSVMRSWIARGVRPRRDVVMAFVADEEVASGFGARWLVAEHPSLFDGCAAGISETGAYTFGVNGVRFYPVAAAERGIMHLRLDATGRPGHGSRPNPSNAVVSLAHTVARLATHRWPVRLTPCVRAYLEQTGAALGVEIDWSDVDGALVKLGRAAVLADGVVRNSVTPTMLQAGYKVNVIPATAHAQLDVRFLPGTADELLTTVDSLLGPGVTRSFITRTEPVSAPIDSPWFAAMADALRSEDPAAVVVPYCMGGGTDAKEFSKLGIAGYGFAPLLLPTNPDEYDYRAMAHGVDERVPIEALHFGARVLDRFLLTV